ncbi:DUF5317 domain-containing protein [Clostridiisalibacter paucivorans]|uniref:DUF5317 domain-containing protein n=1 Tax=Clostridiisalibacter paucivorans TaxID=408753 RepID=UPI00047BBBD3|nr:DUF5317 domain-containing protein [Clostridiisalibacter paucivorans]
MLMESMVTSIAVGKVRGGKIKRIGEQYIKGWYLFIIGFGMEFLSVYIRLKDISGISSILDRYFVYIHILSYILIFIGIYLNVEKLSMKIIFVGALFNFIVIVVNGGQMPVSEEGLLKLGLMDNLAMLKNNMVLTHALINKSTKLAFLGDIIPLLKPYPLPKMISIGDVFLGIGIFAYIQNLMINRK